MQVTKSGHDAEDMNRKYGLLENFRVAANQIDSFYATIVVCLDTPRRQLIGI